MGLNWLLFSLLWPQIATFFTSNFKMSCWYIAFCKIKLITWLPTLLHPYWTPLLYYSNHKRQSFIPRGHEGGRTKQFKVSGENNFLLFSWKLDDDSQCFVKSGHGKTLCTAFSLKIWKILIYGQHSKFQPPFGVAVWRLRWAKKSSLFYLCIFYLHCWRGFIVPLQERWKIKLLYCWFWKTGLKIISCFSSRIFHWGRINHVGFIKRVGPFS